MVSANPSSLKQTRPHEYALRFFFGGLATVAAGLIADRFGPSIGGLFLAFPAIFPAGATLIATHEKLRKRKLGLDGARRGRSAAAVDAAGATLGALALLAFAFIVWRLLPAHSAALVIALAAATWIALAGLLWRIRRHC